MCSVGCWRRGRRQRCACRTELRTQRCRAPPPPKFAQRVRAGACAARAQAHARRARAGGCWAVVADVRGRARMNGNDCVVPPRPPLATPGPRSTAPRYGDAVAHERGGVSAFGASSGGARPSVRGVDADGPRAAAARGAARGRGVARGRVAGHGAGGGRGVAVAPRDGPPHPRGRRVRAHTERCVSETCEGVGWGASARVCRLGPQQFDVGRRCRRPTWPPAIRLCIPSISLSFCAQLPRSSMLRMPTCRAPRSFSCWTPRGPSCESECG